MAKEQEGSGPHASGVPAGGAWPSQMESMWCGLQGAECLLGQDMVDHHPVHKDHCQGDENPCGDCGRFWPQVDLGNQGQCSMVGGH